MGVIAEIGQARYAQLAQAIIEYCQSAAGRHNTALHCAAIARRRAGAGGQS